jgi:cyclopropane fatty-acyl-phospholipid synthase-like methyltransferase
MPGFEEQTMGVPSNWYEDFFRGIPLDLWRQAISRQHTEEEGEFLTQVLKCEPRAHILDVPCGNGRLCFELARRGFRVTGIDISEEFISEARSIQAAAGVDAAGVASQVDFILGDKRAIKGEAIYDGAYCFGNSFGFLAYQDMEKFLGGVARSLKPGARFVVETGMAAESVLPDFEEQTCHQVGDINVIIKERYNAGESCIDSEYIFERDGQRESRLAKHWIYTAAEIQRMLQRAGFNVLELYGSRKLKAYKLGSQELFVVAQAVA